MDSSTTELAALVDREKVRNCIARLARGEDRRDAGLIGDSFWPEASVDLGCFPDRSTSISHGWCRGRR
jgi:hypothetical protein